MKESSEYKVARDCEVEIIIRHPKGTVSRNMKVRHGTVISQSDTVDWIKQVISVLDKVINKTGRVK